MDVQSAILGRLGPTAFGLSHGPTAEAVLATVKGDGVLQLSENRVDGRIGWTLGISGIDFTSQAVYNTELEIYYAPFYTKETNTHGVLLWNSKVQDGDLDRSAKHIAVPHQIHSIHPTSCTPRIPEEELDKDDERRRDQSNAAIDSSDPTHLHEGIYIVFTDGRVGLDHFYTNGMRGNLLGKEGHVVGASNHRGRLAVVTLEGKKAHVLTIYKLQDGELKQLLRQTLEAPSQAILSSISLRGQALSLLWSQGTLQTYFLKPQEDGFELRSQCSRRLSVAGISDPLLDSSGKNGKRLSSKITGKRKSSEMTATDKNDHPIVVTAPGSLVAVLGWRVDGEEKGSKKKLRLTVMDGMYGTARRIQDIPLLHSPKRKLLSQSIQAIYLGGDSKNLAVLAGESIHLLSMKDASPELVTLVGSLAVSERGAQQTAAQASFHRQEWLKLQPWPLIKTTPSWLPLENKSEFQNPSSAMDIAIAVEPRENGGANIGADSDAEQSNADIIERITDPSSFSTEKDAFKLVDEVLVASRGTSKLESLHPDVASLLFLKLAEKGHWKAYRRLQPFRPISSLTSCANLAPILAQSQKYDSLVQLLHNAHNIAAADIGRTLQSLLSRSEGEEERSWKEKCSASMTMEVLAPFTAVETILFTLTSFNPGEKQIVEGLSQCSTQQALSLAKYLLKWLKLYSDSIVNLEASAMSLPTVHDIIQWCNCLIDAHLIGLASNQQSLEVLNELQQLTDQYLEDYAILSPLLGILKQFQSMSGLATQPPYLQRNASYIIELLDISINVKQA